MKKIFALAITILLCLTALAGCVPAQSEADETGTFCRVEWVYEDGFIASIDNRMVLVLWPQADQFAEYDTVFIEFNESDLREEAGTRPYFDDYELSYTHVLENPQSVRLAGPGEPTFA